MPTGDRNMNDTCPNCGYCRHCGHAPQRYIPWTPYVPTYPVYPSYPWYYSPTVTVTGGTFIGNAGDPITTA